MMELSIGEVIEASSRAFTAQSVKVHEPPALGRFVEVRPSADFTHAIDPFEAPGMAEGAIIAVVLEARTASIEPGRRAVGYGLDEDQLRNEQPQIWHLLQTDFSCLIVGFVQGGVFRSYLPPQPPRLHSRVYSCAGATVCEITRSSEYLRTITSAPDCVTVDEVVAASLREAFRCSGESEEFLVRAGKELAILMADDYERLASILRKIR